MIKFEYKDISEYNSFIRVYENGVRKSEGLYGFTSNVFILWLSERSYPESLQEANKLLDEYNNLLDKQATERLLGLFPAGRK